MKYEFTGETKDWRGHELHRIRALRSFIKSDGFPVDIGDLGGWIESEKNLAQQGNCWVSGEGIVLENARLFDDSLVDNYAEVYGNAILCDDAKVRNTASACGYSRICGTGYVDGNARISGRAVVEGQVGDSAHVFDNAHIEKGGWAKGISRIGTDAEIYSPKHIITVDVDHIPTTFYKMHNPTNVGIRVGVWHHGYLGEIDEFEQLVRSVVGYNDDAKPFLHVIEYVRAHFGLNK